MPEILYLQVIAFAGGLIQGLTGFGVVLVALPLMALVIDIKTAIPLVVSLSIIINLILLYQLYGQFETKKWLPILIASLPGIPAGIYIHKSVSHRLLEILVGAALLITSANAWFKFRPKKALGLFWAAIAGFAAGCLGGSIGASGPPVVIFTSLQPWTKSEIKTTLVAFFTITSFAIVAFYLINDFFTAEVLKFFVWCAIPLVLGVLTGSSLYGRITDESYRNAVLWLLFVLGILMLFKG